MIQIHSIYKTVGKKYQDGVIGYQVPYYIQTISFFLQPCSSFLINYSTYSDRM